MEKNELPEGWVWTKIDNVSELVGGGTPSRKNPSYFQGNIVWLTPTEIPKNRILVISDSKEKITNEALKKSSAKLVPDGSVLLTSRATIGNIAIAGTKVTTNQGFASFMCLEPLHNYFLAYWLLYKRNFLINKAKGTTFKEISKSTIREIQIPIPPLREQKRIVSKIEELFSLIDFVTNLISRIKNQIRYYQISFYNSVFSTLEKVPLRKICELVAGQHILKSDYNLDMKGIPYLTGPNDFRENHPEISKWTKKPKAIAKKGDVLITVKGAGVGKVNVLDIDIACISRQLMAIRPIGYPSTFLYYYFKSKLHEFQKLAQSTTVPGISKDRILNYKAPVIESNKQQEIINKLENSQTILFNFKQNIEMLENYCSRMRSTILKQAFTGKLVPQDPNDEPASELLKRMKQKKQ